jgi:hypothetical protein
MAHYDIFRDQLAIRFPGYGHALWEPYSGDLYPVASVGDVGYISQGGFHRLFNILLPADDPSHENFGVPDNHQPFQPKVPRHIVSGTLRPDNFCSAGVTVESDELGQFATRLSGFTIRCRVAHIFSGQETLGRSCFHAERGKAQYYPFHCKPRARIL